MISMISPVPAVLFATRREVCGERACAGAVLNNRAAVGQSSAVCQPLLLRSAVPANAHIVGSTERLYPVPTFRAVTFLVSDGGAA